MLEGFDLRGKVVLLTGGAGIYGRGLASDLAAAHATLIIASRNRQTIEAVAAEETSAGFDVHAEGLDLGEESSIAALAQRVAQRFGRLDGLVNNAVARPMERPSAPAEDWESSMKVNATGLFLMHRYFGEIMGRHNTGSIVNIGSIQGMVGPTLSLYSDDGLPVGAPDYFFHKGGMVNLTRYYAALYGKKNIRVNCISPGGFLHGQPEEFVQRYSAQTFLGRMGAKGDLGGAVVFLLGDASSYITGINLPVDGGYTAH